MTSLIEKTAKVCHMTKKAYCESLGDFSQPTWDEAPEWQKTSAIHGVLFHWQHPDSKPSNSHENWMKEKQATGWIWGPVKDPEKKEHPCMVPYNELPMEQQTKDALFLAVVRSMEPDKSKSLTFEDALFLLQMGRTVARRGWAGKGLFVFMQIPSTIQSDIIPNMQSLPVRVKDIFSKRFEFEAGNIHYSNQMSIVFPDNSIMGWVPSVSDIMADDWYDV